MIPGLRAALSRIDEKHQDEPDLGARDWRFESEEEMELYGDQLLDADVLDEL